MKMKRSDQGAAFTGTIMHEKSQQILRHVLELPDSRETSFIESLELPDELIFSKARDAYRACMDEEKLKALGSGPLIEILRIIAKTFPAATPERASGNSPLLQQHQKPLRAEGNTDDDHLTKTLIYLEKIGVTALVSFSISVCIARCEVWPIWLIPAPRPMIKIPTLSSFR